MTKISAACFAFSTVSNKVKMTFAQQLIFEKDAGVSSRLTTVFRQNK